MCTAGARVRRRKARQGEGFGGYNGAGKQGLQGLCQGLWRVQWCRKARLGKGFRGCNGSEKQCKARQGLRQGFGGCNSAGRQGEARALANFGECSNAGKQGEARALARALMGTMVQESKARALVGVQWRRKATPSQGAGKDWVLDSELDRPAKLVNKRAQPAPRGFQGRGGGVRWGGGGGGSRGRGRGGGGGGRETAENGTRDLYGNVVCDWAEEEQLQQQDACTCLHACFYRQSGDVRNESLPCLSCVRNELCRISWQASQAALVGCGRSQANQGAHAQQGCGLARHSIAMRLLRKQGLPVVVCSQGEGGGGGDGSDAPSVKLYGKWQVEPYVAAAKDGKVGGSDA
eukprot:361296-Pelagomonas_calceolata.AAC.8